MTNNRIIWCIKGVINMDNNEIRTKFKDKVKLVRLALLMSIIGIIFIIGGTLHGYISGNIIIQSIGIVFFVGGIAINNIVWRCPVCNKSLPYKQPIRQINYCSNCSAKLK